MNTKMIKTTFEQITVGSTYFQPKLKETFTKIEPTEVTRKDFYKNEYTVMCECIDSEGKMLPVFPEEPVHLIEGEIYREPTIKPFKEPTESEKLFGELLTKVSVQIIEL